MSFFIIFNCFFSIFFIIAHSFIITLFLLFHTQLTIIETKELNIQFDYIIHIPKVLPLPDTDLCILLLNILDNALESSILSYSKWIKLEISLKGDFLFLLCQNSHQGTILEKDGNFLTQKSEKDSHGYGIPIIKSILKKYGDMITISYDSEQFTLKAVLQF